MEFLRKIAFPFSILYGLITSLRNYLYDVALLKSTEFKTPTIVVGNLSVGGTGKTPQIEYLIDLLKNDYKIAVLSRGYKRRSKGFLMADSTVSAEILGDEPFQIHLKYPEVIVCVDADRTNGITKLEELENPPEIILLDDAFQHRKVRGGFNVLLTTFENLYVNDTMLPTGDLRENASGANRAQAIIVTKCPADISETAQAEITKMLHPKEHQQVFFTAITYDTQLKGESTIDLSDLSDSEILLVTGIANPNPLTKYLKSINLNFKHLKYADHHHFSLNEITEIDSVYKKLSSKNNIILTTEKDYVRIFGKLKNLHYISIKTTFITHKNEFNNLIKNYVEQSSGNS
ncbi:MAG: tetraacyldisaccharide 4'-kinase [Lutibacter sp.]|nr:tetraacyldisaccharide 4'-kinase [Lutibacter sp.]MDP3357930.1 tetraacyldisaccharide 4'-kinase [Lutibacter sp.]